jgi:hypothetical protein
MSRHAMRKLIRLRREHHEALAASKNSEKQFDQRAQNAIEGRK